MLDSLKNLLLASPGQFRQLAASWRRGGLALVALCLTVYLPGLFAIPPIDRDEPRFAQASRQMFEAAALPDAELARIAQQNPGHHDGGWVIPKVQDQPRLKKPPLIYWLQTASAWVFTLGDPYRDVIWMYRIPSMLAALAAVLLTWRLGLGMFDPRAAWLGAAFLAIAPMIVWDAHEARADQVLLATVALAQLALWRVWKSRHEGAVVEASSPPPRLSALGRKTAAAIPKPRSPQRQSIDARTSWLMPLLFWFAQGLGLLTKGPVTPMISLFTIISLCIVNREVRWIWRLRPLIGIPLMTAMVAPWVIAVADRYGGLSVFWGVINKEIIDRAAEGQEGHWGPPGYHTVLLGALLWPGSMFIAPAIIRAWQRGRPHVPADERRRIIEGRTSGRDAELFLLAWIVPAWILFELYMTKLPHYVMPMYPALALIGSRTLFAAACGEAPGLGSMWLKWGLNAWAAVGVIWVVVAFALTGMAAFSGNAFLVAMPFVACVLLVGPAWAMRSTWMLLDKRKYLFSALCGMVVITAALAITLQLSAPAFFGFSSRVSNLLIQADPSGRRPIASVDYHEDSMIFFTRGRVSRITSTQLPDWLAAHPDGIVVLPEDKKAEFPALEPAGKRDIAIVGFNYTKNNQERVYIMTRKQPQQ